MNRLFVFEVLPYSSMTITAELGAGRGFSGESGEEPWLNHLTLRLTSKYPQLEIWSAEKISLLLLLFHGKNPLKLNVFIASLTLYFLLLNSSICQVFLPP